MSPTVLLWTDFGNSLLRTQLPAATRRKALAEAYGEVYFNAWSIATGSIRLRIGWPSFTFLFDTTCDFGALPKLALCRSVLLWLLVIAGTAVPGVGVAVGQSSCASRT